VLLALIFGLALPLITAVALWFGTFAAARGILVLVRTWPPVHDWVNGLLGLTSFGTTVALILGYFIAAVGFWSLFW